MNDYLQDLFQAFQNVNQRYYFAEVFRDIDNYHDDKEAVKQSTENSFSAELFRHLRNIMETESKIFQYHELALDFDVRKNWFDPDIITKRTQSFRPDLTLHKSQLYWDPPYQKLYVEVKTNKEPYVKDDIQKLANAIERLHFERGAFISVNSNYNSLKQIMKSVLISENIRLTRLNIHIDWDKIYLFHSLLDENQTKIISQPISFLQIINE